MSSGIPDHERGQICPLCGAALTNRYFAPTAGGSYDVDCPVCGDYKVSSALEDRLAGATTRNDFANLLPYLRSHVRQQTDSGETAILTLENYEPLARARMTQPIDSKLRKMLQAIAAGSRPGEWVQVDLPTLALRVDAGGGDELMFLLDDLLSRHLVESRTRRTPPLDALGGGGGQRVEYRLTVTGFQTLHPLTTSGLQGVAFVAMSFDPSRNEAYEAIRAAIETDCGLSSVRIDRVQHNDQITDRILAGIRSAQFTIADVTGQRAGVYFEAGFAMGLGRPVIWCCERTDLDNVHFDTRQFSHVVYENMLELRAGLTDRIRGTVLTPMRLV